MKIADYFCSRTKPIRYVRNHYKTAARQGNKVVVEHFALADWIIGNDQVRQSKLAPGIYAMRQEVAHTQRRLDDNAELIENLQLIDDAIRRDKLRLAAECLQDLFPPRVREIDLGEQEDRLRLLYWLFICYRVIVWEEASYPTGVIEQMKSQFQHSLHPAWTDTEICWHFVSFVSMIIQDRTMHASLVVADHAVTEVLRAESLYDALIYQLLLHFAAGRAGLDGASIAECQGCHQPFKKLHGNQKFCPLCGRNSERARDYKARRKEAHHHDTQSNP